MDVMLKALVDQLNLEPLEVNLFRGQSSDLGSHRVFGGQVIGQALVAATRTVEGRLPHSLHAYFILAGDVNAPIVYEVDRLRDGKSFSTRRVNAIQHGQAILSMLVSFQVDEHGLEHQIKMPEVPAPETLRSYADLANEWSSEAPEKVKSLLNIFRAQGAIEFRPVAPMDPFQPRSEKPAQEIWFRAVDKLGDDPLLHRCMLAFASDFNLIGTALRPHKLSWYQGGLVLASLDHALWFHRSLRVDDWLLYSMDAPSAQDARGLTRGQIFDRSGRLVASVAQEGLMRQKP